MISCILNKVMKVLIGNTTHSCIKKCSMEKTTIVISGHVKLWTENEKGREYRSCPLMINPPLSVCVVNIKLDLRLGFSSHYQHKRE